MNFCKNQLFSTKTARRDALQLELSYKITVGNLWKKKDFSCYFEVLCV